MRLVFEWNKKNNGRTLVIVSPVQILEGRVPLSHNDRRLCIACGLVKDRLENESANTVHEDIERTCVAETRELFVPMNS